VYCTTRVVFFTTVVFRAELQRPTTRVVLFTTVVYYTTVVYCTTGTLSQSRVLYDRRKALSGFEKNVCAQLITAMVCS
jgi:hypothetical protein